MKFGVAHNGTAFHNEKASLLREIFDCFQHKDKMAINVCLLKEKQFIVVLDKQWTYKTSF